MKGLSRTQKVSLGYMHDLVTENSVDGFGKVELDRVDTDSQKGDLFTKAFGSQKFWSLLFILGVVRASSAKQLNQIAKFALVNSR